MLLYQGAAVGIGCSGRSIVQLHGPADISCHKPLKPENVSALLNVRMRFSHSSGSPCERKVFSTAPFPTAPLSGLGSLSPGAPTTALSQPLYYESKYTL
ncbi:hypothetical protein MRX96_058289 [Rhipicephalus microplus]